MRRPGHAFLLLLILAVLGFVLPAVTLAAGGGSAGDQQYTDPFGSSGGATTRTAAPSTASTPTVTAPPTTAAAVTAPAATPPSSTVTPTAVAATSGTTGTSGTALPRTGYDGGLAALLGAGLVLGGAGLRIRLRKS